MGIELHIAGPGLDIVRRLEPGADALILGRDAECGVCLPDPERNVSRRHLSVWNNGGELHFHVLSVVNGVEMPFGEAPPGARGVLPHGQTLRLAAYAITARGAPDASQPATGAAQEEDPWAVFDRDASGIAPVPPGLLQAGNVAPPTGADADPFGDWGFETTFGPDHPDGGGLQASGLGIASDIGAFLKGLGLDPREVGSLSIGELEAMGRLVREAVLGLRTVAAQSVSGPGSPANEERTLLSSKQPANPMDSDWDDAQVLRYLFGGRAASIGLPAPERAIRSLVQELQAHEAAMRAASAAAVDGVLQEFDPEMLKASLLGGGGKLFESARAWESFSRFYGEQAADRAAWVQRLLAKYFAAAYASERDRAKHDTPGATQ